MTSRVIDDNVIYDLYRDINRTGDRLDKIENNELVTLPTRDPDDFPIGNEGDTVLGNDDLVYIYINGAWVALTGGGGEWDALVTKTSDESMTGTTLQDDNHLFFTATSGKIYFIEFTLIFASPAGGGTPDIKVIAGEDNTYRGMYQGLGANNSIGETRNLPIFDSKLNATPATAGTAAGKRLYAMEGWHTGAGGTWKIQWAQNTSNANNLTVYTNSYLRYKAMN